MKRLFAALVPPPGLARGLVELNPRVKGVRWLSAKQLHLTLAFLGETSVSGGERLKTALARVAVPPFVLPVAGIGCFGGARPSVVWAGTGTGHPHLYALHRKVNDAILAAGLEADLKPFKPHITLGRARGVPLGALRPFLRRHENTEFGLWPVDAFALFSSVPGAEGSVYTGELEVPLESRAARGGQPPVTSPTPAP